MEIGCSDSESDGDAANGHGEQANEETAAADPLENYVSWIIRATCVAEGAAEKAGVSDWVATQRRRKWMLAGHLARRHDGRWSKKLIEWEPTRGTRRRGHPKLRWDDAIKMFLQTRMDVDGGAWLALAQDCEGWSALAAAFAGDEDTP